MFDTTSELLRQIAVGEDSVLELKDLRFEGQKVVSPDSRSLAAELSAMANTLGGILVLGVDDKTRLITGIPREKVDIAETWIRNLCYDSIDPQLDCPIRKVVVPAEGDVFVCALGDPESKRKYVELMMQKGGQFVSVVHPSVYIGRNVDFGVGCIIGPNTTLTSDIVLGNHVIINANASINHDDRIGDYTTICPGCHLAGRVQIGRQVFMGIGVSVIPDISLGDGVFVGAGAVVTGSFVIGRIVGCPAHMM